MVLVCVWQHGGQGDGGRKEQKEVQEEAEGYRDAGAGVGTIAVTDYIRSASFGSGGLQLVLGFQDPRASHL